MAAKDAALSGAEGPAQRQKRSPAIAYWAPRPGYLVMPHLKPSPGNKMVTWDRTPLGLETAAPWCQPRAALAVEGSERRWNLLNSKVPALHREAERDTTGSFSRQPLLHTWIGLRVQAKRRSAATVCLIHCISVKLQLTVRFYCGNEGCLEAGGFIGAPRKSLCFAGVRRSVRCSISIFRCPVRKRG
jgi:hypothetical protein